MRLKNKDIAKMLGISATAVSLAINGRPGVSDETRRKVLELVAQSDLAAYEKARVQTESRGSVAFVIHKASGTVINNNQFFSSLVEMVQQQAMEQGFSLTIVHYLPGQSLESHLQFIRSIKPDGLLIQATELSEEALDRYLKLGLPTVLLDGYFDLAHVDAVTLDDQTSILRAFHYAVSMGHRDIGFLAGATHIKNFEHHLDGFYKGIRDCKLEGTSNPVITLRCPFEQAYDDMRTFLANLPRDFKMPTCFIADLDNIALGAMKALKEANLSIPDDVSIIGYGNTAVAAMSDPPLTTTQIDMDNSGKLAVELLAKRMRGQSTAFVTATTSSDLVIRNSVKKIDASY